MSTDDRDTLNERVARLPADRQVLIEKLLKSRDAAGSAGMTTIPPRDRSKSVPLSYAQQRLWFLDQLGGDEPFYNADFARRFSSAIDFGALEQAVNEVVRRHESLRTTFDTVDGEPIQVIAPRLHIPLVRIDISELPLMRRESEAVRLALEEARQPFDLRHGPLLRTKLVKLADDDYMLLLTMHHIVCDGWSMRVLTKELTDLYGAFVQDQPSPLPQLPIQYADYAVWQRNWLEDGVLEAQLAYWRKQLAGLTTLRLPSDRPRPPLQTYRGSSWFLRFPSDLMEQVRSFSQRQGVTPFMTLLTAYFILLHRYSSQDDIVVGAPIANRNRPETQSLIGFFVNTLVMRTDLSGNPTVRELIDRVGSTVSEAFAHQDAPFERLVEALQPQRDLSRNPIFQVSLQFYQAAAAGFNDPKATRDRVHVDKGTASIDLGFDLFEAPEGLMGRIEYSTDLFERSTVERMVCHFQTLLGAMPANLDTPIADLPMLTSAERELLLVTWNQTRADYPRDACVHQLVEAQAERTPEATAVVSSEGDLTYRELDRKSNQLASYLQSQGVKPDVLVAICMERSLDMTVALLGILKAGGAYLPLDPAYPKERLSWLLEDSQAPFLLTQPPVIDRLPATQTKLVCLEDEWYRTIGQSGPLSRSEVTPRDLAYVIYTSGSTGRPNGVMIEHRAACMQLTWMQQAFPLSSDDRVVQKYSLAFDAALLEIFWPLSVGTPVVLADREQRTDPAELLKAITRHGITVLDLVPSLLQAFVEEGSLRNCRTLRRIVCGGETMPPSLAKKLVEQLPVELVNMYGPTETTVNATFWRYQPSWSGDIVPIGRPCGNTQIYILDERGNPVPVGVPGEIHIGGDGVARGYLNRPELTQRRFVANPFSEETGARLFRTGDRGRYLASGDIEFLGRLDDQVKISGFRVETGEIQAVAASHNSVRSVHVTARDSATGRKHLVAFVVPHAEEPEFWPSIGEYFAYDELTYYAMTHDEARNRAYRLAIAGLVRGKAVLDLGTGADALWARHCIAEGAKHVYAIEMLDHAYEQAKRTILRHGLEHRITLLHGDSMRLSLPEQVDVSVSELIGTIGSSEGCIPILNNARRFLKPGGTIIPHLCTTKIAAVSLPDKMRAQPCFTELTQGYVDRIFSASGFRFPLRICLKNLPDNAIVSDAADFEILDFMTRIDPEQKNQLSLTIARDATIDGFLLWVNLYPSPNQFIDVIKGEHSWLPVFFPVFYPGLKVGKGDSIEGQASVLDNGTLTPDYRVHGRVRHVTGEMTPFDYTSYHQRQSTELGPFHGKLLVAPRAAEPARAIRGVSLRQHLIAELRTYLKQRLPDYMVPSAFVLLRAMPLMPSGKIDPAGLPDPDRDDEKRVGELIGPRTQLESTIAAVWQELLGVETVGIQDNFFDLGGHSLMIIRLQNRLRKELDADVSLTELFQFPTISALAAALANSGPVAHERHCQRIVSDSHREIISEGIT